MGATDDDPDDYPERINVSGGNDQYGRFAIGNGENRTGIYQLAYRDMGSNHPHYISRNGRPYDDFYFSDSWYGKAYWLLMILMSILLIIVVFLHSNH